MEIDIVIPYVDGSRPQWIDRCNEWREKEGKGPLPPGYARDYGTLKYTFRAIENNAPWVRKVFLVVQDQDQVPEWVNRDEVNVVLHEEYIPKELLPTFTPHVIEGFYPFIKGLASKYVNLNDDMFFLRPIPEDYFFRNGLPVMTDSRVHGDSYLEGYGPGFGECLDQGLKIERRYGEQNVIFFPYHFPGGHLKELDKKIISENHDEIMDSFRTSHFRSTDQIALCAMCSNITRRLGKCVYDNSNIAGLRYVQMKDGQHFDEFKRTTIACFNDNDNIKNWKMVRANLDRFLFLRFPSPSKYEV